MDETTALHPALHAVVQHEVQGTDTCEPDEDIEDKKSIDAHDIPSEEDRDEEGLHFTYDSVIIGTGIVESILACAIQLIPGKRVLHLDPLDFYGRELSSLTLNELRETVNKGGVVIGHENSVKSHLRCASDVCEFVNGKGRTHKDKDFIARESDIRSLEVPTRNSAARVLSAIPSSPISFRKSLLSSSSSSSSKVYSDDNGDVSDYEGDRKEFIEDVIVSISLKTRHPSHIGYLIQREKCVNSKSEFSSSHVHPSFFGYVPHNRMNIERAVHESRRFSIDLSCKLLLSGGKMVESMIKSDVGRYLEFKAVENVYIVRSGNICNVPCSKSDVFNSKLLTAIEKRVLMKFLQFANDWGQVDAGGELSTLNERELSKGAALSRPQNKNFRKSSFHVEGFEYLSFRKFMEHNKIPENLQEIIVYALCLDIRNISIEKDGESCHLSTLNALRALHLHLNSLGRYGSTAFLYPLYGVAEISQAFCRMCAVWGGIYILRRGISQFIVDKTRNVVCAVEDDTGKIFGCRNVICRSTEWIDDLSLSEVVCTRISICEGDCALFDSSSRAFGVIPPGVSGVDCPNAVHIVQLNSSVNVCPLGCCLLYLITTLRCTDEHDKIMNSVAAYLHTLHNFEEIYAVTLTRQLTKVDDLNEDSLPTNVAICREQLQTIHFQDSVDEARSIFMKLYPGEEFLRPTRAEADDVDEMDEVERMIDALDYLEQGIVDDSDRLGRGDERDNENEDKDVGEK